MSDTFKIKPGEWEDLTKDGIRIHYIQNNKDITQYFALTKDGRKRVLVLLTADEHDGLDPLREQKRGVSDPT